MQDEFQKKVLDTLKKNLKAVDLSDEQPEVQPVVTPEAQPEVQPVDGSRVLMSSSDFTAFGAPTAAGPTSGGNKDILILPGYGGAAATSASLINFYWNSPTTPDQTGVGTSIRSTIYNYATSTTNPVLVIGGYNGTVNYMPFPNYGGGSGVTAKIWLDPFLGRMDIDYIGFNSGVADTNVAGVLFYDSTANVFKGGNGSGAGKTIAFTSDIPAVASSAALVNTDAVTATRFLIGTVLNTASSGGTSLSTGSGITMGNNVLTATTFQGSLSGTATTATNVHITAQTTGTFYPVFVNTASTTAGVALGVESALSWNAATDTLTAANFSGTASSSTNTANANITLDTTSQIFLTGSRSNASIGSTPVYVLSGVSALGNTITATTFSGNATTATNAGAAGQWITSRTVTFATGDVTGSFSINGSADVSNVALTIAANSVALGTDTTGNYAQSVAVSGSGITLGGTAGEGTDFTVYSSGTSANTVSTLVFRDSSGNFSAGTITAALTGTASIASSSVLLNTTTDTSSTLYLLGSRSSTGFAGTAIYVDTNLSFVGNTITGNLTGTASIASSSVLLNTTTDTASTLYLLGSRSSTGFAGTAIYVDTNVSIVGNTITANLTGTATTATRALNTDITLDTTSQIFLTGSRSNASIGSTPTYVLSGVSALGNTITATTFSGSLSGIATTSTNLVTTTLSGTMYLTGQSSSTGAASGSGQFVGSGLSYISTTGTLSSAFYIGSGIQLSGIVTSLAASTGISVNSATGAVTVTNTGVISLTGTANQVLVAGGSGSATSGNITLTLPQSIATTSSPSFADITLTTGTNSTLATVGTSGTSIVNKQYVDNLAAGLDIHESMRVIQQPVLSANYVQTQAAGSAATSAYLISTSQVALPAIDGVTISATGTSQRVLVIGGFNGTASIAGTTPFTPANSFIGNGSYFVVALGGAGTSNWILRRTTDADDNIELTGGTFTFIEEGTSYADSGWVCSNDTLNTGSIQFGSTAITFTQFTGGGALGVGQGLTKVGNTVATKVNLFSTGTASGTGFTQFNFGGAGSAGVADTGYYPTFSVRTSGTVAGTALLTLNSDGFSLVGSTSTDRTITVTGSNITLTGGGNTLTLTGSISLPAPTQHGIAYGSSGTAVAFLTSGGTGASVLTQTTGSAPVYLGQSQLVVGGATTSANVFAGTTNQLVYQTNANTTGFVTLAAGSGASVLTQTSGSAPAYLGQSQLVVGGASTSANIQGGSAGNIHYQSGANATAFVTNAAGSGASILSQTGNAAPAFLGQSQLIVGGATTAAQWQTARTVTFATGDVTGSFSINGTADVSNVALTIAANSVALGTDTTGNYAQSVAVSGSGITLGGTAGEGTDFTVYSSGTSANTVSTLVFRDGSGNFSAGTITAALTGTASIASSAAAVNTVTDTSSTLYLLGSRSSTGIASTQVYVDTNISIVGGTITATTFSGSFSGTATSAAQVNTNASTATRYLIGTVLNTASGSTQLSTGSGITIGDNRLTSGGIAVTNATAATSTSTGALTVTGGVGVGGSLWTATANFSSISGVGFLNSAITSGTWNGTAISLTYGGTNANLTAVNGGVVYSTGSAMAISAAGTAGSVLVSAGAAAPTWSAIGLSSSSVTGILGIANGGNNATTYTTNSITYYDGSKMVGGSSLLYTSGAGVTATENIRAAGFNIAGNSVVTSLTPSGGSAIYGGVTIAVANNGAGPGLSVAGASSTITITGPGTGLTGTGTANSVAKFTASGQLGNSNITDNGTTIALGKATTITDSALSNGTYLTITTAAGDDSSTTDFFIRGLTSGAVSKFSVDANGNLRATTKSFDIEHPTKPGKRLVYGVLEGPEHGVYHRGTIEGKGKLTVELPEYWSKLVGAEYSIQLTPWGNYNAHIVEKSETSFIIQLTGDPISRMFKTIKVDYIIHGSRLDAPLVIEQ
jgi:hypothetical protein